MADESKRISAEDARMMLAKGEGRPIDIRPFDEVGESRVPGAIATDPDDLDEAVERATREDAEITMIVVSNDDDRGDEVAERLREMGHEAFNLDGGFGAWVREGARTAPPTPEYEGPELKHPGASAGTTPDEEELADGEESADAQDEAAESEGDQDEAPASEGEQDEAAESEGEQGGTAQDDAPAGAGARSGEEERSDA